MTSHTRSRTVCSGECKDGEEEDDENERKEVGEMRKSQWRVP